MWTQCIHDTMISDIVCWSHTHGGALHAVAGLRGGPGGLGFNVFGGWTSIWTVTTGLLCLESHVIRHLKRLSQRQDDLIGLCLYGEQTLVESYNYFKKWQTLTTLDVTVKPQPVSVTHLFSHVKRTANHNRAHLHKAVHCFILRVRKMDTFFY